MSGIVIQPSEIMKIAVPLMLAWFFQKREGHLGWREYGIAFVLLAIPAGLIMKQPDLGTALLVAAIGLRYFPGRAGMESHYLPVCGRAGVFADCLDPAARLSAPSGDDADRPDIRPVRKGLSYHSVRHCHRFGRYYRQGAGCMAPRLICISSRERTTDFIFAVFAEEFGLIGNLVLMVLYLCLIGRGLMIALNASSLFSRLLAGAITMMFFMYAFVNMGMVSGILPVVGVPLPFMSYGGTAMVTLGLGAGILMSIQRHRKLVQT